MYNVWNSKKGEKNLSKIGQKNENPKNDPGWRNFSFLLMELRLFSDRKWAIPSGPLTWNLETKWIRTVEKYKLTN